MNDDDLWVVYTRIQRQADSRILSSKAWAIDEALDAILDRIGRGETTSLQQADNLITNRATKHRHRQRSLGETNEQLFPALAKNEQLFPAFTNDNNQLDAICDLGRYRQLCSTREWRILVAVGEGHTYSHISSEEGVPEPTVKTWVRRLRLKLAA